MSHHVVSIDANKCYIGWKRGQLICKDDLNGDRSLPLEDIAAIVITSFSATLHSSLILEAAKKGVALILCERFEPVSLMLPVNRSSDTLLTKATLALDKRKRATFWKKTLHAKCKNQLAFASSLSPEHPSLRNLSINAEGDRKNKEATCGRHYWQVYRDCVSDSEFRRQPKGDGLNSLLNYGYAVLLSIMLQKLLAVGLDPTFGIHHEIRERSAPLAYDMMEPFRPLVDARVYRWVTEETGFQNYEFTTAFRRYVGQFVVDKVGYLNLEIDLASCVESVVRGFRNAILSGQTRDYKPWMASTTKWGG